MNRLPTGSALLDRLLGGGLDGDVITTVYGPAGAGKTTVALLATISAVQQDKRVLYIDTEGGFSTERLQQLTKDHERVLNHIIFLKPTTFDKQKEAFDRLRSLVTDDIGLVVVDSIAMLYRMELGKAEDVYEINRHLGRQIGFLTELARTKQVPVLITNQGYAPFDDRSKFNMVGGDVLKYGSKCLLELRSYASRARKASIVKHRSLPEGKQVYFTIEEEGFVETKPHKKF